MNHYLLNQKKSLTLLIFLFAISNIARSATFTAIASGDWSSTATWGVTAPSFSNTMDQIIIPTGIMVNLDNNVTLNGALAQLTVNGTLNTSTSSSLIVTSGTISGTGLININNATFGSGAVIFFTGNFTANTMTTASSLQVPAKVLVNQVITVSSGIFSIQSTGTFTTGSNATIVLAGGQIINNGGVINLTANYNVSYTSGTSIVGLELSGTGLKNLTIDVQSGNTIILTNDVTINGTLSLTSGTLSIGNNNLTIKGDIAASGTGIIKSNSSSNITIINTTGITGTLNFGNSTSVVNNFILDIGSANQAKISGAIKVNGTLTLTSGTLNLTSADLDIAGDIALTGNGKIASTSTSNITISSNADLSGTLTFQSGNNTVNNFSVNIGGGGSVRIKSDLIVQGNLNFSNGKLNIGANKLTILAGGSITGAGSSSYIVVSDSGKVSIALTAGAAATKFPIGTAISFFPADITLNSGSTSGRIDVGVNSKVYASGTTGFILSTTQHVVDATWHVSADFTTNMNMMMKVSWPTSAEVNGFVRTAAYISHYTNAQWDAVAVTSAAAAGAGMYSMTRANITTLSPFAVFDQSTTTGVNTYRQPETTFDIYPNPATKNVYINTRGGVQSPIQITIFNMKGQVLNSFKLEHDEQKIDISKLEKGYYYIQMESGNEKVTKKLIIN